MKLFRNQRVIEKTSGKIGIVRTAYNEEGQAVVSFGEGWVKLLPASHLKSVIPTIKRLRCITDDYDNFVYGKIYIAKATGVNENGVPFGFEVLDEEGFEFPALPSIFEEVKKWET